MPAMPRLLLKNQRPNRSLEKSPLLQLVLKSGPHPGSAIIHSRNWKTKCPTRPLSLGDFDALPTHEPIVGRAVPSAPSNDPAPRRFELRAGDSPPYLTKPPQVRWELVFAGAAWLVADLP